MQQINYSSLEKRRLYTHQVVSPKVVVLALSAVILAIVAATYFANRSESVQIIITLAVPVLFAGLFVLSLRLITQTRMRRNEILQAFADSNNFIFTQHPNTANSSYSPEFISNSTLLAHSDRITPRSNMELSGVYRGVHFSFTIVEFYRRTNGDTVGVMFFSTIIIRSQAFRAFPPLIALSKSGAVIASSLNLNSLHDGSWYSSVVGWEANAFYNTYIQVDATQTTAADKQLSKMLANLHAVDKPDLEINGDELYIINVDGVHYTKQGMKKIFDKIEVVADYLAAVRQ